MRLSPERRGWHLFRVSRATGLHFIWRQEYLVAPLRGSRDAIESDDLKDRCLAAYPLDFFAKYRLVFLRVDQRGHT